MRESLERRNLTKTFENLNLIITEYCAANGDNLRRWQRRYVIGAALGRADLAFLIPAGLIHALEGRRAAARRRPDERTAPARATRQSFLSLANRPSPVSVHVRTSWLWPGNLQKIWRQRSCAPVQWKVVGKSGVTARQTIEELLPRVPDDRFDYILVGLGGNDV